MPRTEVEHQVAALPTVADLAPGPVAAAVAVAAFGVAGLALGNSYCMASLGMSKARFWLELEIEM